jgi:hypothetical protein
MEERYRVCQPHIFWGKLSLELEIAGTLQNKLLNIIENENLARPTVFRQGEIIKCFCLKHVSFHLET